MRIASKKTFKIIGYRLSCVCDIEITPDREPLKPPKEKSERLRDISNRELNKLKIVKDKCEECGATERLHRHHKDKDKMNNVIENIQVLCSCCHRLKHPELPDKMF